MSVQVQRVGAPPWSILAVTFTRKAAEEIRTRVREALGEEASSRLALGTFHSVCARLLRWYGDALPRVVPGLDSRFSIFDIQDSRRVMADIIKENGLADGPVSEADETSCGTRWAAACLLHSFWESPSLVMEHFAGSCARN